MFVKAGSISH